MEKKLKLVIDNYTLESSLGKGTLDEVFLATKKGDKTSYAAMIYDREIFGNDSQLL